MGSVRKLRFLGLYLSPNIRLLFTDLYHVSAHRAWNHEERALKRFSGGRNKCKSQQNTTEGKYSRKAQQDRTENGETHHHYTIRNPYSASATSVTTSIPYHSKPKILHAQVGGFVVHPTSLAYIAKAMATQSGRLVSVVSLRTQLGVSNISTCVPVVQSLFLTLAWLPC